MTIKEFYKDKVIYITGACGTVGSEILRQLTCDKNYLPSKIIATDNNESSMFYLDQKYKKFNYVQTILSDIRDKEDQRRLMSNVDIVLHTAALKHVHLCEYSPTQAIATNINGLQNIISSSIDNNVKNVIFTSSDKAVNPTNVMGTTKLTGERLISAANNYSSNSKTIFTSTRFGNILGSNGSVVPTFIKQISQGGPVTLTNSKMTRFVMNVRESVEMVLAAGQISRGGEVFVTKMKSILIKDLAEVLVDIYSNRFGFQKEDIKIQEIGSRPGEKDFEELLNIEEIRRTIELNNYFCILPVFAQKEELQTRYKDIINYNVYKEYSSAKTKLCSKNEIQEILLNLDINPIS